MQAAVKDEQLQWDGLALQQAAKRAAAERVPRSPTAGGGERFSLSGSGGSGDAAMHAGLKSPFRVGHLSNIAYATQPSD